MQDSRPSVAMPAIVRLSDAEVAMWRRFTPAERLAQGLAMHERAKFVLEWGVGRMRPHWDEDRVKRAAGKLMIGDKDWPPIWPDPWAE